MADRIDRRAASIVVTGLGAVTAFGWGAPRLRAGLRAGRPAIGPIARFDASRHRTRLAAEVPLDGAPAPRERRASLADRFAVASALEAIGAAGLRPGSDGAGTSVFFGSSTGGMLESESFLASLLSLGPERARTRLLAAQQFNAPGDAVARAVGATGPVVTVSSACASAAMAIGEALRALRRGETEIALAGGSDSLCQLTYAGFNSLRSVDERPCRPFRRDRAGLSLGEGAAVLVLETRASARRRGARPLAVLAGAGTTCDAHHMTAPHPDGAGAAEAIAAALADAGAAPEEVDFVNAHGTGTPLNDAAEAKGLARLFGRRAGPIPVTSTKALLGHLLGSAGAVEAAATIFDLLDREVHAMPDEGEPDPALALDLVVGRPRPLERAACALSANLAFGGANTALVFRSAEEPDAR